MGRITFQKRQKEMKRQEKQRMKAERRAERKLEKSAEPGTSDPQLLDLDPHFVDQLFNAPQSDGKPSLPAESEPQPQS